MLRPVSLAALAVFPLSLFAAGPVVDPAAAKPDETGNVLWYDVRPLGIEGQGWADTKAPFDRLPAKAEKLVRPPVWGLSRHSAGLCVRFVTDAPTVQARWTVTNKTLAMPHMPATGVSGLDLYARGADGRWSWVANGRPAAETTTTTLAGGLPAGEREYLLYLPLYNGVSSVEIGLPKGAKLKKADDRPADRRKPVVFYGTSITQGGCASRPGMVHTAILGRRFDVPVINLGFSGNGTLDREMADLLGEIDAAVYVLDCLPNLGPKQVAERTEPFVKALRKARPGVPVVMVEDRVFTNAQWRAGAKQFHADNHTAFRKAYESLTAAGVEGLHYLPGDKLLGDDGEGTVDGSHPTDLGFLRQADAFAEVLGPLLKGK
ncbi:MAG: hypothetical protein JWO38_6252 [Gemmataceae bacterium]|nr:hypothetical protein [Gemmataceae bacterium]